MSEQPTPKRMTLGQVVERLTEGRRATSTVTIKMSAAGQLMPEVDIAGGEDWSTVQTMVDQAEWAFTEIFGRALGNPKAALESVERRKADAAKAEQQSAIRRRP